MTWQKAIQAVAETLEKHRATLAPAVIPSIEAAIQASQTQLDQGDSAGLLAASERCRNHLWGRTQTQNTTRFTGDWCKPHSCSANPCTAITPSKPAMTL